MRHHLVILVLGMFICLSLGKPLKNDPAEGEEDDDKDSDEKEQELAGPQSDKDQDKEEKAELNPKLFEGDLKLDKKVLKMIESGGLSKRDVISSVFKHWPNGRVPYAFDSNFDEGRRATVRGAIEEFNKKTCVRFVERQNENDYIYFIVDGGCYSTGIGKNANGGVQHISIGNGCNWPGVVIHEMMHAIGFFHEQSRLDRDNFITIYWGNIMRNMESQFRKYAHGEADYLGEPYDYESVMHYPRTAFSRDGRSPTIVPKNRPWQKIGQRDTFSEIDLRQINKLYSCKAFLKE